MSDEKGWERESLEGTQKICRELQVQNLALKERLMGMENPKATVGRTVWYMKYGTPGGEHKSEPSPAIITKVLDEATQRCQLFVMNPNGLYFNDTPYSEELKPGCWSWPPRV